MSSINYEDLAAHDATGASVHGDLDEAPAHTLTIAELVSRISWAKHRTRVLVEDGQELLHEATRMEGEGLDLLLRKQTAERGGQQVSGLVSHLASLGFSWSDIARMFGVSVPALRKWRHGESPSPDNRRRIAEVVAVLDIIADRSPAVEDVAGWLEMRLVPDAPISGISLLADGRYDLIFRYAFGDDPQDVLDLYQPDWRTLYETDIEVFVAPDGHPALRPRSRP